MFEAHFMGFKEIIIKIINVYGYVDFSWNVSRGSLILFSCCQLCTISIIRSVILSDGIQRRSLSTLENTFTLALSLK